MKFFAQQYKGIPRKRLVKMAYMSDVVSRQYLGEPISGFEWIAYHYGPYSEDITAAIGSLVEAQLCWIEESPAPPGEPRWKKLFDSGRAIPFDFSLAEHHVLGFVVETFLDMPMEELMEDVVYRTSPWLAAASFGEKLKMHLVDQEGAKETGFDLAAVLKAERQVEEGRSITAQEFFDGLSDRIARRYRSPD